MNLRWFQKGNSSAVVVTAPLLVPALLAIFSVALIVSRSYKVRPGGVLGPTVWWLAGCAHFSRLLYAVYEHPGSLVSDLLGIPHLPGKGPLPRPLHGEIEVSAGSRLLAGCSSAITFTFSFLWSIALSVKKSKTKVNPTKQQNKQQGLKYL